MSARGLLRPVLALVVVAGVVACGSTEPSVLTLTGRWSGTMHGSGVEGITFAMVLVETNGTVSGSANIGGTNVPKALTVTGTFASPNVSLTMTEGGLHPPLNLTGTITGNTLTGSISGSGFTGEPIVMTRAP